MQVPPVPAARMPKPMESQGFSESVQLAAVFFSPVFWKQSFFALNHNKMKKDKKKKNTKKNETMRLGNLFVFV